MADDQIVPGENANYEDYNYARWSETDKKWVCYRSILTGDGVDARSTTCVSNHGIVDQQCQAKVTKYSLSKIPVRLKMTVIFVPKTRLYGHFSIRF